MTVYGYARVSTDGQTLASQDAQLHEAGCAKVYAEKVSGAKTNGRAELGKVLKRLQAGDVLVVTRLDRLARSTRDLLNILHMLGERSIGFKSLADAWADSTTPHGRLLVTMLAGIAEFERELIRLAQARAGSARRPVECVLAGRQGSASAACRGRDADRYCAKLQRLACDDWQIAGGGAAPFRGRRGRPMKQRKD